MHHQRLRCIGMIEDAARRVPGLLAHLPRGYAFLGDELRRAIASAALNTSEGNGRTSPKERARFFDIAIGSLAESATAISMFMAFRVVDEKKATELSEIIRIAYAMVINLKRSMGRRKDATSCSF